METAPLEARNSFFKRTRNNSGSQSRHSNKPKSSSSRSFLKRRGYGQLDSDEESAFPEALSLSCDVTPTLNDAHQICPALFASSPHEEPLLTGSPEAEASNDDVPVFEAPPPIPARQMKHSSTSSRDSPVPALPRPPQSLSRRQNSRKDRKNSQKRPPVRQISLGEQIFPLDEIHRLPVDLSNLNNPFSIRPIGASATFDSLYSSSKIKNSSTTSYVDNSWNVPVTCSPEKDGSETSEDGSSLLLPNSNQKNCAGIENFSISEGEVFSDEHEFEPEEKEEAFSSDSDFEVADLDLSTEPVSTEGDETATEYGSTNNLAQFEPEVPMSIEISSEASNFRPRPNSLNLPHDLIVSGEKMSPETPTPCSKGSTNDTLHSSGGENYGVDYLLQSLDDNENEMTVDARNEQPSSFSGFVKLKRSRKPRIKARQWVPVQISIADKSVLLFSEDGRLVEEVDIHADQNVSAIQVERSQDNSNCNSMPIYVVKLLRCFYKAKKLVGIGSAKSFSDLQSTNSVYEKYATKVNQILKVGLHDYLSAHSFASLLSKAIKTSELASEDVEILASPVCRLIVDVFDEINCEINEQMEICAANSSVETAIEVLAFSVDSARFELNFGEFDQESEADSISPSNFRMHPLAIPPENEKYSYETSRAIQICPVNTARMEILRFNTAFESFNLPILLKVDYTISAKNFSVACSLHFDEMQNVAALQNVTIHLPMATSCSKFSSENWFISNTVGKWKMEGNWLIWSIDSLKLSNQETKQQFLSAACRGSNSEKIPSQVAILQYEQLNETAASKTRIKHDKIDLQSQRSVDDDATVINYRSKYFAKVWIRLN